MELRNGRSRRAGHIGSGLAAPDAIDYFQPGTAFVGGIVGKVGD